ncbi:MAG TPA: hypothetical protein VKY45_05675 [Marinilabiliaceae bacterium]|nr:hypothetical protein [Marinilabiliaceae bacterium]
MQTKQFEEIIEDHLKRFEQQVELPFNEDLNRNMTFIRDGILDVEKYMAAPVKILWVLKEANSPDDSIGNDMRPCLTSLHSDDDTNSIAAKWGHTWNSVAYTTYGIFEKMNWVNLPDIKGDAKEVLKHMPKIAHVNVKKFAGESKAKDKEMKMFFDQYKALIYEQIEIINPDVIIFGSTFKYFSDYFNGKEKIHEWPPVYKSQDKLLIDTCHPNGLRGFGMTQQQYCDHIINAVIQWMEKR